MVALILRVLAVMIGLLYAHNCARWLFFPQTIADFFQIPLLAGEGASTQIGGWAAFFFTLAMMSFLGARAGRSDLLLAPFFSALSFALFRIWVYIAGRADLVLAPIIAESFMALVFLANIYWRQSIEAKER